MDDAILADWDPSKLNVRITHKHPSLSAYIYQGKYRDNAVGSLVEGNAQVNIGDTF